MTVLPPFAYLAATLLQAPQAVVTGTIRDQETGAPIAGAEVVLSDLSRVTTADAEGRYVFVEVPAGPQHLAVRYIGYAPRVMHALVPREGTLQITIALHPSPRRLRTIEVRPPVAVRGLDADTTSLPGRALSIAAIRNHPLLAEPDALEALTGGGVVLQPESPGGVHVYGGSADETAYALDGVPVLSPYHSAGLFTAWNPDALAGVSLSPTGAADDAASGLSGVISGATRSPGDRVRTQGALSTTQGRLTVDGPVGIGGAGFLASIRSGFPGGVGGGPDPSRIRGETGDELAKLVVPVAGGELHLLAYDNENELNAAAVAETEPASPMPPPPRNRFEWKGTSLGGEWRRETRSGAVRLSGWSATTGATASWLGATGPIGMASSRSDLGGLAAVERRGSRASTVLGVRFERSLTAYDVVPDSGSASWELLARTPMASVFARQTRALTSRVGLELGATATVGAGGMWLDPGVRLEYRPDADVHLSASWIRRHQLSQSLRNPESLIGNVFPADFFVGSGAGVPVARSDLAVLALEIRPSAGLHFGASGYARQLDGLALVATRSGEPFGTTGFATGSGTAYGGSFDASFGTERYAVVAGYDFQRLRLSDDRVSYAPEYGTAHLLSVGAIVFPTATSSVRIGLVGSAGRRGTQSSGAVEWESCNLLDKTCELAGSPRYQSAELGATGLPPYLRLDLGVRQHFHLRVAGRDAVIAVFGTMTNLLGRSNVLAFAPDPSTGARGAVEMRPFSPLVVGLDWQY